MTSLLKLEDVRVSFGGVHALDGVTMEFEQGLACGVIGPNGSGKTTLLGVISRLTPLSQGRLTFEGQEYSDAPAYVPSQLGIARTFQSVRLLHTMNVQMNVMVGAGSTSATRGPMRNWLNLPQSRKDEASARGTADEMLERVGMTRYARSLPQDLPYGLQRRVEIARALATKPKLLLLDEPMAGMARSEREDISSLLKDLLSEGLTQIFVEHDLSMIHRVCETSYALDFGKVIASGPPRDVADEPAVREAYLGHAHATKGRIPS